MSTTEGVLLWSAIALYVVALILSLLGLLLRARWGVRPSWAAVGLALLLHLAAGIARWIITGHPPVMYAYENSLTGAAFIGAIYLLLAWRVAPTRKALPVILAAVLLLLGNGLTAEQDLLPLQPPFRSAWLAVHVTFAWVAFGSFLVASVMAGMYLVGARRRSRGAEPAADEAAPRRLGMLDDVGGRLIALGFAGHTVMISSGAIWAHGLWGRYWAWDPVETWSLVTWLIYGVNLHLRFTLGWRGPRAAWLALLSVLAVLVTFFGIGVISDVHTELL